VDASIMPTVLSCNTFLSTIMLAEKIADAIKSDD
jgi:choline dehydrogenase-like flavoprotein